jgi:ribosomal protein S18 acetylase RimI-like enzyme
MNVDIRTLPPEEAAVRRYVEDLWVPYHRDLEATVSSHALADDLDLVEQEVRFQLEKLEAEQYDVWIARSPPDDVAENNTDAADLVGFVTTDVDTAPPVFDRPKRLVVGDVYVTDAYRGTGLVDELFERAAERARDARCSELVLDVDVDNDRAIACYEKLGFETARRRMAVAVDDL